MMSKTLLVLIMVCFLSDFSYGQIQPKPIQDDYNYIEAVDSLYKLHTTPKNWHDAKRVCAQEGARLFYPENSDEANAVISYWKLHQNNTPAYNTWVFVGMSDIINEGEFETIDGKLISEVYNEWSPTQPDNSGDEDCLHLSQIGHLNDIKCNAEYNFICKKTLLPMEQNCSCLVAISDQQRHLKPHREDYNYVETVKNFYKFHTLSKSWRDAKRVCAQEGASLFYPENSEEANAVISLWKLYQNNTPAFNTWVFIGISDIITEGEFETIDGKLISEVYNEWSPTQPDNSGDEDCLHLSQIGHLNDVKCNAEYNFICKKSPLPLEQNCSCSVAISDGQRQPKPHRDDYNYVEAVKSFYKYHTTPKKWRDAKRVCAQEGASLFYPENSDEANAIISFWKVHQNNTPAFNTWVFVGISDIVTEGEFETIDGKLISEVYKEWSPNQPDNSGDEDCLHLSQIGHLNDVKCDAEYNFICKKSPLPLEQNCSCSVALKSISDQQRHLKPHREDYNYVEAVENFYKFHTPSKNWRDAKRVCVQEGASLFYPENSDEANAVIAFWKLYQNNTPAYNTWVFVGISDIMYEGEFETIDGKFISEVYSQWSPNQPDNSGDEDCLHMSQIGHFNDIKCDTEYSFICKKTPPPLEQNCGCPVTDKSISDEQHGVKFFREDYTYIESEESFYKIHTTQQYFADAEQTCALEEASLFYAENIDEVNAVVSFWNRTQPLISRIFVGLSERMAEGLFETVDESSTTEVYSSYQPSSTEHCVHIDPQRTMNVYPCDSQTNFICKRTLQSLESKYNCSMPNSDYTCNSDIGKCYKLHTTPLNWADAIAKCQMENSSLAVINNQMEAEYLANLTESSGKPVIDEQSEKYHLGFQYKFNEGWRTVKGTPLTVGADAWLDKYQPDGHPKEECGAMVFNGQLINTDCNMTSMFICEHELESSETVNEIEDGVY